MLLGIMPTSEVERSRRMNNSVYSITEEMKTEHVCNLQAPL